MKTLQIQQLDEKEEEIADILISLGISRNVAVSLSYLKIMNSATSIDIERVARLRQPEVSNAMKQLKERDWIIEQKEKKPGKGRPIKKYSLKVNFDDIIAQIENQQKKSVDGIRANVERLKNLDKYE